MVDAEAAMKLNCFKLYLGKRKRFWSVLSCFAIFDLIILAFIPLTDKLRVVVALLIIVLLYMLYRRFKVSGVDAKIRNHLTAYRIIKVKEFSLGGHSNFFLAEDEEKEFKAQVVYGNCNIGDSVLVVSYDNGENDVICEDFLENTAILGV